MEYISDILLGLGALAAAFYCVVLSRKINRLSGLDQELGSAIALLSKQVDDLTKVLHEAQSSAETTRDELTEITLRAENAVENLNSSQIPYAEARETELDHTALQCEPNEPDQNGGLPEGAPSLFLRHSRVTS